MRSLLFIFIIQLMTLSQEIQPLFSCWFFTYVNQTNVNIVLGYNNAFTSDQFITITNITTPVINDTTNDNIILPLTYNGNQPYIFTTGYTSFATTINDYLNLLQEFNISLPASTPIIQWIIGNITLNITKELIIDGNRCSVKYANDCPVW